MDSPENPCLYRQGVIGAWLTKPLRVAWKTKQSPDYPSEMYFTKADGYAFTDAAQPLHPCCFVR